MGAVARSKQSVAHVYAQILYAHGGKTKSTNKFYTSIGARQSLRTNILRTQARSTAYGSHKERHKEELGSRELGPIYVRCPSTINRDSHPTGSLNS
ncbi:hypothetical protein Trydic_g22496 [Trypoxylus dichotomus]